MTPARFLYIAVALSATVLPSAAAPQGAPLSAIDWLSDSVDLTAAPLPPPVTEPAIVALPGDVVVAPLDQKLPDAAGLLEPADIGLAPGLWGRSSSAELARAIAALPPAPVPSLRRFLHDLLVTRLDPPADAASDDALFLARVDKLLTLGRLGSARALLEQSGVEDPSHFRRVFDIALLDGSETEACRIMEATPDISPTYPARIFCLARLGEWDVAALTLGNAEVLGILTPAEDALLRHFLDPDLFEGEALPPRPAIPTPLEFRLYEAMGERFPTEPLPVAFARADLSDEVGWKLRLRAAERLMAAGEIPPERFFEVLRERKPAASGGVWDRAAAFQRLVRAVETGDTADIEAALGPAWAAMVEIGAEGALAGWVVDAVTDHRLNGAARRAAFEAAIMADRPALARRAATASAADQTLLAVIEGRRAAAPPGDPLAAAVLEGLATLQPGLRFAELLEDDRAGEALLQAMTRIAEGAEGDPDAVSDALGLFRHLGLHDLARRVGAELLLKNGQA